MNVHVLQALHQLLGMGHPAQRKLPVAQSDGSAFQRLSNGGALVNNQVNYPVGTQEDDPRLQLQSQSLQLGRSYPGSLGTADGDNPQSAGPPELQGMGMRYQLPQIQGRFNPGRIPLQQSNTRYRQGPQPTQPWYDF